jgi:hypothetical protein
MFSRADAGAANRERVHPAPVQGVEIDPHAAEVRQEQLHAAGIDVGAALSLQAADAKGIDAVFNPETMGEPADQPPVYEGSRHQAVRQAHRQDQQDRTERWYQDQRGEERPACRRRLHFDRGLYHGGLRPTPVEAIAETRTSARILKLDARGTIATVA